MAHLRRAGRHRFPVRAAILALGLIAIPALARSETRRWALTVLGPPGDPRSTALSEAVEFWNQELARMGTPLRLGPIARVDGRIDDDTLRAISRSVRNRSWVIPWPERLDDLHGDILVVFSSADLVSVGIWPARGRPGLVVVRRGDAPPLALPNVARNVLAHEPGHVLGLMHNDEPGTLMCGSPARCPPTRFRADSTVFFPLTATDRRRLARRFRP